MAYRIFPLVDEQSDEFTVLRMSTPLLASTIHRALNPGMCPDFAFQAIMSLVVGGAGYLPDHSRLAENFQCIIVPFQSGAAEGTEQVDANEEP